MTTSDSSNQSPDWDAIARHRAGESDAAEAAAVDSWLASHPGDADLLASLDVVITRELGAGADAGDAVDVERALARLHDRMDVRAPAARLTVTRGAGRAVGSRRAIRWAVGGLAAAAAVALLTLGVRRDRSVRDGPAQVAVAPAAQGREYRTAIGVVDSVMLADGTRIILAPQSRLVVAAVYGQGAREVTLEGMARFTVRHDAARPFAVRAGAALLRDVGTQFVVRAPREAALGVTVAVSEGEVSISAAAAGSPATSLRSGDRAVLQSSGVVVASHGAAADDDAWTRGLLVYHDATLDVVRDDLRRWYGIDLQVADVSLASKHLTATFERNAPDQALRTLALALGATIERAGTVATLRSSSAVP